MPLDLELERSLPGFPYKVSFTAESAPTGILGASGAGKSMTLRAIAGLEPGMKGRIVLDDRVLFDSTKGVNVPSRARNVGLLFQHYALFPHMTVEQNIAFGLRELAAADRKRRVEEQIAAMRLDGLETRYPAALSGGQQQRVALARALAPRPAALLLDEPFSALDTHLRAQLERQLRETLTEYRGVTLLVSHNLEEIYRVCQQLLVLEKGTVIARGPGQQIFSCPPDRATAQLTGCKNFSAAASVNENTIDAADWGCRLRVNHPIPVGLKYVAIRAHHIRVMPDIPEDAGARNCFPCWLASASEAPFDATLYLSLNAPSGSPQTYHLQAEVTQDEWSVLRTASQPWRALLPEGRLLLLGN